MSTPWAKTVTGHRSVTAIPERHLDDGSIYVLDHFFPTHETWAIAFNRRGNADARVRSTQLPNFHSKEKIQ